MVASMKRQWLDRRIAAPGPFLALALNQQQLASACRDLGMVTPEFFDAPGSSGRTWVFDGKRGLACIVAIKDFEARTPIEIAGLLVHEAVHVWQQYADDIGERNPGSEQEAYAIQSIAQELMAEFARQIEKQ